MRGYEMVISQNLQDIVSSWYENETFTDYELFCMTENLVTFFAIGAESVAEYKRNKMKGGEL